MINQHSLFSSSSFQVINCVMEDVYQIIFGVGVGWLRLGSHINDILETFSREYPRLEFEIMFPGDAGAVETGDDVLVNVPQWGIRLRFQPLSQTLYFIDVHSFKVNITFSINGILVRGQEQVTTFSQLQKALGPTFPGKFIDEGKYLISFEGVGLLFNVPLEFQDIYADGKMLPIILPDKTSAVLQRVYIHGKDFDVEHPESYPDMLSSTVRIVLKSKSSTSRSGTYLHLLNSHSKTGMDTKGASCRESDENGKNNEGGDITPPSGNSDMEISSIELGMTPQDVVSILGAPDFASLTPQHADLFTHKYEYKTLGKIYNTLKKYLYCNLTFLTSCAVLITGMELYFAKNSHALYRIVAHTNLVQHQDFGRFYRCGFSMAPAQSRECSVKRNAKCEEEGEADVICAVTPWNKAQALLEDWFPKTGGGSDDTHGSQLQQNLNAAIKPVPAGCPFPATQLHAYPALGVMFEVAAGGVLSSVTLMDPQLIGN